MADDHMNLKTDSSGRVYAVVKTSRSGSSDPLVVLLVRGTSGNWTSTTVGLKSDHHTRPIVELDEVDRTMHVSRPPRVGGRHLREDVFDGFDRLCFRQGNGRHGNADGELNNATSTKQNVNPATGLVVLASGQQVYFHQYFSLGAGGGTPPAAAFSGSPTSGTAPFTVQFTDNSTGGPTSWQWDFQNDGTVDSIQQNPSFVYPNPGTYSVRLTVSNGSGSDSTTRSGYVSVTAGGPALSFAPTDDSFVRSNFPDENNGSLDNLRTYKGASQTNSFLKFTVSGERQRSRRPTSASTW